MSTTADEEWRDRLTVRWVAAEAVRLEAPFVDEWPPKLRVGAGTGRLRAVEIRRLVVAKARRDRVHFWK